jgi:hypothetical protein
MIVGGSIYHTWIDITIFGNLMVATTRYVVNPRGGEKGIWVMDSGTIC